MSILTAPKVLFAKHLHRPLVFILIIAIWAPLSPVLSFAFKSLMILQVY